MKKLVVAIDGPAGAGKSTVAQLAAKELGYTYIDTGAMYRAVAWKVLQQGGEVTDEKILAVIPDIDVDLSYENGKTTVRVTNVLYKHETTPYFPPMQVGNEIEICAHFAEEKPEFELGKTYIATVVENRSEERR